MRISTIKEAKILAQEFITTANFALAKADKASDDIVYPSKENATLKRKSMDLTRVLADMRQGR